MEQFSLDKYLENPNRKITTRYGDREVRIICTDRKGKCPIVALMVDMDNGSEYITSHSINGWSDDKEKYPDKRDLFFADEEEKLTEFEKAVRNILARYISNIDCFPETIKDEAKSLLDLARKELKSELDKKLKEAYNQGGLDTQEEITKCLPKWKKDNNNLSSLTYRLDNRGDGNILLCRKGYAINLIELLNLPIEN